MIGKMNSIIKYYYKISNNNVLRIIAIYHRHFRVGTKRYIRGQKYL